MKLLDTPQWQSLTVAEKNLVSAISGNDTGKGFVTRFTKGGRRLAERLEDKGLITVQWDHPGNGQATLKIREEGWQ